MGSRSNIVQTCEHGYVVEAGLTCALCEYHRSQEGQVAALRAEVESLRAQLADMRDDRDLVRQERNQTAVMYRDARADLSAARAALSEMVGKGNG